jgi:hypothetical protein
LDFLRAEEQPRWRIRFRHVATTALTAQDLAAYLDLVQSTADQIEKALAPDAEDRL